MSEVAAVPVSTIAVRGREIFSDLRECSVKSINSNWLIVLLPTGLDFVLLMTNWPQVWCQVPAAYQVCSDLSYLDTYLFGVLAALPSYDTKLPSGCVALLLFRYIVVPG